MRFVFRKFLWSITVVSFILTITVITIYPDMTTRRASTKIYPDKTRRRGNKHKHTRLQWEEKLDLDRLLYNINKTGNSSSCYLDKTSRSEPLWEQTLDFDRLQYSNETGHPSGCCLVPNYIHFIHFGGTPLEYVQLICVLAAFKNQKPEKIFFHYDDNSTFTGKYWEVLLQTPGFKEVMVQHKVEQPTEIYGQPLDDVWRRFHGSDITRIRTVMKYGGIYLDNDSYLIKSVDIYRKFEISLNWDEEQFLGSQVIIAHKDARFLRKWLECYKVYKAYRWYYNAGQKPTVEVLYKQPHLVHRVRVLFGADVRFRYPLYHRHWPDWRKLYIIHLLINQRADPVQFNENNIAYYPITLRQMAYDVYDVANIKWPKAKIKNQKWKRGKKQKRKRGKNTRGKEGLKCKRGK